jgi:hypothetical protein
MLLLNWPGLNNDVVYRLKKFFSFTLRYFKLYIIVHHNIATIISLVFFYQPQVNKVGMMYAEKIGGF